VAVQQELAALKKEVLELREHRSNENEKKRAKRARQKQRKSEKERGTYQVQGAAGTEAAPPQEPDDRSEHASWLEPLSSWSSEREEVNASDKESECDQDPSSGASEGSEVSDTDSGVTGDSESRICEMFQHLAEDWKAYKEKGSHKGKGKGKGKGKVQDGDASGRHHRRTSRTIRQGGGKGKGKGQSSSA